MMKYCYRYRYSNVYIYVYVQVDRQTEANGNSRQIIIAIPGRITKRWVSSIPTTSTSHINNNRQYKMEHMYKWNKKTKHRINMAKK